MSFHSHCQLQAEIVYIILRKKIEIELISFIIRHKHFYLRFFLDNFWYFHFDKYSLELINTKMYTKLSHKYIKYIRCDKNFEAFNSRMSWPYQICVS